MKGFKHRPQFTTPEHEEETCFRWCRFVLFFCGYFAERGANKHIKRSQKKLTLSQKGTQRVPKGGQKEPKRSPNEPKWSQKGSKERVSI